MGCSLGWWDWRKIDQVFGDLWRKCTTLSVKLVETCVAVLWGGEKIEENELLCLWSSWRLVLRSCCFDKIHFFIREGGGDFFAAFWGGEEIEENALLCWRSSWRLVELLFREASLKKMHYFIREVGGGSFSCSLGWWRDLWKCTTLLMKLLETVLWAVVYNEEMKKRTTLSVKLADAW